MALEAIVFAAAAGFAFVVLCAFIVVIGVYQEERRGTFLPLRAPGPVARFARLVVDLRVQAKAGAQGSGKRARTTVQK